MHQKQDYRRFHRSPKMFTSPYQQNTLDGYRSKQLINSLRKNNDTADHHVTENNLNKIQPFAVNIIERLVYLERSLEQQKMQRLNQHNKIIKMIKQFQCKHSSIIYDSQIKFHKSTFKHQSLTSTTIRQQKNSAQNSPIKISTQSLISDKKQTRLNTCKLQQYQKDIKNSIIQQINTKSYSPSKKIYSENPQKQKVSIKQQDYKQINIGDIKQKVQQNIHSQLNQRLIIWQQEISTNLNIRILQLNKQLTLYQQNLANHIATSIATSIATQKQHNTTINKLSEQYSTHYQNITQQINKIKNNIKKIQAQESKYNMEQWTQQINTKIKQLQNLCLNIQDTLTNNIKIYQQKIMTQLQTNMQQIYTKMQQKIQIRIQVLLEQQIKAIQYKIQQNNLIIQQDINKLDKKITDVQNYSILKYQLVGRQIQQIKPLLKNNIQTDKQQASRQIQQIATQIKQNNQQEVLKIKKDLQSMAQKIKQNFNNQLQDSSTVIHPNVFGIGRQVNQKLEGQNITFNRFNHPTQIITNSSFSQHQHIQQQNDQACNLTPNLTPQLIITNNANIIQ